MNDVLQAVPHCVNTVPLVPSDRLTGDCSGDLQPVSLVLELQSSAALLSVLTTVARLGSRTTHVYATERQVALGVLAPRHVAHRLVPCLNELIEVLAVMDVNDGPATVVDGVGEVA